MHEPEQPVSVLCVTMQPQYCFAGVGFLVVTIASLSAISQTTAGGIMRTDSMEDGGRPSSPMGYVTFL